MTQLILMVVFGAIVTFIPANPRFAPQKYRAARLPGLAVFQVPASWKVHSSAEPSSSPDLERLKRLTGSRSMPSVMAYSADGIGLRVAIVTLPSPTRLDTDALKTWASTSSFAPAISLGLKIRQLSVRAIKLDGERAFVGAYDVTPTLPGDWNRSEYRIDTWRDSYVVTIRLVATGPGPFREMNRKVADLWSRIAASWKWQDGEPAGVKM